MASKIVVLTEPVFVGGQEIREVNVRRSCIGDEEDAMQQAIQMKRPNNFLTVEMNLMARVTGLPFDVLRAMHGPDYAAIRRAMNELNGLAPDEAPDENPTMQ